MKILLWLFGLLVSIPVGFFAIIYGASELGGEVVTLERPDPTGEMSRVRVWIVDSADASWIEHGDAESYWINQLAKDPAVQLSRDGELVRYAGVADPDSHDLYHQLRRAKYGWADQLLERFTGAAAECQDVPVRLRLASR